MRWYEHFQSCYEQHNELRCLDRILMSLYASVTESEYRISHTRFQLEKRA